MALRFFAIPVRAAHQLEAELNGFLSAHRILAVDRKFVEVGENSFWAICVDYLPSESPSSAGSSAFGKKPRIDYREILPPQEFAIFIQLRELRKQVAQAEAVPVYTIFTNDQLAEMVRRKVKTNSDLQAIEGVGEARVGKYGPQFLAALEKVCSQHEASGSTA
jgi:superfamily II DNA helicase RecQ